MARDADPDRGPNTQADFAAAMAAVRARAGISLGQIANASGKSISKTTASYIETPGKRLPSQAKLRAFLTACGRPEDEIEAWCTHLRQLRSGTATAPGPRIGRRAGPLATPDGDLWQRLFELPLVRRMAEADFAPGFPRLKKVVELAAEALGQPWETAPAYTVHAVPHAIAVVRRLGELLGPDLLGPDLRRLGAVEAQLLILGAFLHDVGRVPSVGDPPSAEQLSRFLDQAPGRAGDPPAAALEDYCRWARVPRLRDYLKRLPPELLYWDGVPLRDAVAEICRYQAAPAGSTPPEALPGIDVTFCACLLALATRLELCGLRPADDIHRRLGIVRRAAPRISPADLEWTEHVRDLKLVLQRVAGGADGYEITAEAIVLRPVAEFDLRETLDALEAELRHARAARRSWSPRWRGFPLPGALEPSGIRGVGYTYERLTFELAREDVLKLFVGDQLYGNQYAFVRELLQNSIDAVRLRKVLEPDPPRGAVAVSCWEEDGSVWFRIDDNGVGMDLPTIRDYFLQIGRSYYNSEELARMLRRAGRAGAGFRAISRFGIGIVSCFMLGDRIEVSTRKHDVGGAEGRALRLSVNRREDFAALRMEGEGDDPMPGRPGEPGLDFRETPGTSLAVHIDGANHFVAPGMLLDHAGHFHFTSDCALTLNGRPHEGIDLDVPLIERVLSITVPVRRRPNPQRDDDDRITGQSLGRVRVWGVPLDLSRSSPDPRLRGQVVAIVATVPAPAERPLLELWPPRVRARLSPAIRDRLDRVRMRLRASADLSAARLHCYADAALDDVLDELGLGLEQKLPTDRAGRLEALRQRLERHCPTPCTNADVETLADLIAVRQDLRSEHRFLGWGLHFNGEHGGFGLTTSLSDRRWWSHNGITLPVRRRHEDLTGDEPRVDFTEMTLSWSSLHNEIFLGGKVGFYDKLRPDLSLARDEVQSIPFAMAATLLLALRRAAPTGLPPEIGPDFIVHLPGTSPLPAGWQTDLETVLDAVDDLGEAWQAERVLTVGGRGYTINEIAALAERGTVEIDPPERDPESPPRMIDQIGFALAQRRFDLRWRVSAGSATPGRIVVPSARAWTLPEGLLRFPPLQFLPYEAGSGLRTRNGPWNARHPVCKWVIDNGAALHRRVPGHFEGLRAVFLNAESLMEMSEYLDSLDGLTGLDQASVELPSLEDDHQSDATWAALNQVALVLIHAIAGRIARVAPDLAPGAEAMRLLDTAARRKGGPPADR